MGYIKSNDFKGGHGHEGKSQDDRQAYIERASLYCGGSGSSCEPEAAKQIGIYSAILTEGPC
jgi:hypothetical protein